MTTPQPAAAPPKEQVDVYVRTLNVLRVGMRTQEVADGVHLDWSIDHHGVERLAGVEVIGARGVEVDGLDVKTGRPHGVGPAVGGAGTATPADPPAPTVDEMEAHFIDANELMGQALVAIGMALGLPAPRTGATWGAPEILARIADLSSEHRVETAAQVLHSRRHRFGTAPTCGACRDDATAVAAVLTPTSETGETR